MAYLIGAITALGALFGVVKIMHATVCTRTGEIGNSTIAMAVKERHSKIQLA
jgi:hypothetical protein